MKYLFFDLEYATSKGGESKICEFGYVITDEQFNVVERDNLIIDPNIDRCEWDYRVVRKILTRSIREYEACPKFTYYYNKIVRLITGADLVIGHTLDSDAKAINDDCKRYGLDSINYEFYDVKLFYKQFANTTKDTGVVTILKELNIEGEENEHDAGADAFNTMLELKAMLKSLEMTIQELIDLCPEVKNKSENYVVKSLLEAQQRKEARLKESLCGDGTNDIFHNKTNKRRYLQFLDNVKPQKQDGIKFKDKKVAISINYEDHHYRQMLNLIQLIVNEGGSVILKASLSDIFMQYEVHNEDGSLREDSKLKYVLEANRNGANIEIIDIKELLSRLDMTEEELDAMPMVSFDFLFSEDAIIKDRREKSIIERYKNKGKPKKATEKVYSSGESATTLGDLLKTQGVDLNKL